MNAEGGNAMRELLRDDLMPLLEQVIMKRLSLYADEIKKRNAERAEVSDGVTEQLRDDAQRWRSIAEGEAELRQLANEEIADLKRERDEAAPVLVSERLPDEGETVIVYCTDEEGRERYDFDCIEDGGWVAHALNYEHFMAVGGAGACGPDVTCKGPAEDAPYTHWAKIPKRPAIGATTPTTVAEDVAAFRKIVDGIGGKS